MHLLKEILGLSVTPELALLVPECLGMGIAAAIDDLNSQVFVQKLVVHDEVDDVGRDALMGVWTGLGGLAPVLRSGVELALDLLAEFEETLATLREKVLRSAKLLTSISLDVDRIEQASARAVLTVGPLFEPVAQFASYLIEHLPFDISAPFEDTMGLVRRLLASVPNTIRHLEQLIIQPFERYLSQGQQGWTSGLTRPLREQLLAPAAEFLGKWSEADAALADKVLTPTTAALERRGQLRAEIAAYKSQHNLN